MAKDLEVAVQAMAGPDEHEARGMCSELTRTGKAVHELRVVDRRQPARGVPQNPDRGLDLERTATHDELAQGLTDDGFLGDERNGVRRAGFRGAFEDVEDARDVGVIDALGRAPLPHQPTDELGGVGRMKPGDLDIPPCVANDRYVVLEGFGDSRSTGRGLFGDHGSGRRIDVPGGIEEGDSWAPMSASPADIATRTMVGVLISEAGMGGRPR